MKPVPLLTGILLTLLINNAVGSAEKNLKLPAGFTITKVADDDLATNIYCLSTNPRGDVFVAGPGYIRRMIDANGDGIFESSATFSELPKSGAQGLYCGETFLLAVGDNGLWRFDDWDKNGIADGPPQKLMDIGTNGEHLAHAIRRGPDGWFYLIAGNATRILPEYYSGELSPVKKPRAGFLMRMSPDFQKQEIIAHGFRNAYDFAFNSEGKIFVYDSDGERDISLPWYRPTRVFQIQPGDDAGWVDEGWKRPSSFFDMPTEIGALGRGSPTGVEVYRGQHFPPQYDDAIFVADWTFGRVISFRRDESSNGYDQGSEFAVATGQFGFAVTDLVVANDGSLLVSVGGRGTAGSVYRISYQAKDSPQPARHQVGSAQTNQWRLQVPFNKRADWTEAEADHVLKSLLAKNKELRTVAMESLTGRTNAFDSDTEKLELLVMGLQKNLDSFDRELAKLVYRLVEQASPSLQQKIAERNLTVSPRTLILLAHRREKSNPANRMTKFISELMEFRVDQAQLARIGQLMLGGCGEGNGPPMFKGYTAAEPIELTPNQQGLWLDYFSHAIEIEKHTGDLETVKELGRLAAMLQLPGARIQELMLEQIDENTNPIDDIHWLACLAQTGSVVEEEHQFEIGRRLAEIDRKLKERGLPTDRNWIPRMKELAQRLIENTPQLGALLLEQLEGRAGQSFLFDVVPAQLREPATAKFAIAVERDWENADLRQLQIVGSSRTNDFRTFFRTAAQYPQFHELAIAKLARSPQAEDRELFLSGLGSWNLKTINDSALALRRLSNEPEPEQSILAFRAAQRLSWDKQNSPLRDDLIRLMLGRPTSTGSYKFKQPELDQAVVMAEIGAGLKIDFPNLFEQWIDAERNSKRVGDLDHRLSEIDWRRGNRDRGEKLYRQLQCAQCHTGNSALGPRLEGVGKRFSRQDLFDSIVNPSRQISDRYRATIVETIDGMIYKGATIYESVDGITLQDSAGETMRINATDIQSKTISEKSLMPDGLLDMLLSDQWADLEAFLKSL